MTPSASATVDDEFERLRSRYYNAVVVGVRDVHVALRILQVRPDWGRLAFVPGQYTVLGLGEWERCLPKCSASGPNGEQMIRRAYSVCCTMLDNTGKLVRTCDCDYLEFYIALAPNKGLSRPRLTSRLFCLGPGQRIHVSLRAHGRYTLAHTTANDQIAFIATGTGEAPHNAMLMELLASGHQQSIVSLTCVRRRQDLAYLSVHRELERRFSNYRYLTLTTREAENLDPRAAGYVGKKYVQDYFASGAFEHAAGMSLDPKRTHIYLCGNPAMVGLSSHRLNGSIAGPTGMVEILQQRGFQLDEPHRPGNLHCERFW